MRRVVAVCLPTWATDRLRRNPAAPPPETPLVTVASDGRRMAVVAADPAALALGIRPAMAARPCPRHGPRPGGDGRRPRRRCRGARPAWPPGACATRRSPPPIRPTGCGSTSRAARICSAARRRCWRPARPPRRQRRARPARPSPTPPGPRTRWRGSGRAPPSWSHPAPIRRRSRRFPSPPSGCPGNRRRAAPARLRAHRPAVGNRPRPAGAPLRPDRGAAPRRGLRPHLRADRAGDAQGHGGPSARLPRTAADRRRLPPGHRRTARRWSAPRWKPPARAPGAWTCCSSAWTARCRPSASAPRRRRTSPPISRACSPSGWKRSIPGSAWKRCGCASRSPSRSAFRQSAMALAGDRRPGRRPRRRWSIASRTGLGPAASGAPPRWKATSRNGRSPPSPPSATRRRPPGRPACRDRCACSIRRSPSA